MWVMRWVVIKRDVKKTTFTISYETSNYYFFVIHISMILVINSANCPGWSEWAAPRGSSRDSTDRIGGKCATADWRGAVGATSSGHLDHTQQSGTTELASDFRCYGILPKVQRKLLKASGGFKRRTID